MSSEKKHKKIRIGISVGDVNGVGLEVIMGALSDSRMFDICTPVVYASSKFALTYQKTVDLKNFNFNFVGKNGKLNHKRPNLIDCWNEEPELNIGEETPDGGTYALKSLNAAVKALEKNDVDVIVTAPINKHNIQSDAFNFPGHTEYLANAFSGKPLMFMISGDIKIGVVTGHIALSDVASTINEARIIEKIDQIHLSLKHDFGIRKPKIAVLGLNPHSGDKGVIGSEDDEIIAPTIKKSFEGGKLVYGPYSADSFFASAAHKQFDAVLAMYHDQGLIPFKTLSFSRGVNFTAGLSVIRTSPDHGTAYDIVGKSLANPTSFREAMYLACKLYRNRVENQALSKNPLPISTTRHKNRATQSNK